MSSASPEHLVELRSYPLRSNVSLRLTGDRWKEVVVAAALAPHVNQPDLPSRDVARS